MIGRVSRIKWRFFNAGRFFMEKIFKRRGRKGYGVPDAKHSDAALFEDESFEEITPEELDRILNGGMEGGEQ